MYCDVDVNDDGTLPLLHSSRLLTPLQMNRTMFATGVTYPSSRFF